jgi:hypothetical protein
MAGAESSKSKRNANLNSHLLSVHCLHFCHISLISDQFLHLFHLPYFRFLHSHQLLFSVKVKDRVRLNLRLELGLERFRAGDRIS